MRTLAEYTAHDVAPADQAQYTAHVDRWQTELHPSGALECYFAAEIVRAAWRIERYCVFETPDMSDQARAADVQSRMLRYRDQTNLGIRRNLEELRRLQSDRYLQAQLGILLPGVASLKLVLPGLKRASVPVVPTAEAPETPAPADIRNSEAILHAKIQQEERRLLAQHAKARNTPRSAPTAPRNAPCPCNSGQKYKHCCGHWSKSPLPKTA